MMRTTIVHFQFSPWFLKWWNVQFKFNCWLFLKKTKFYQFFNPVLVRSIPLKLRLSTWLITDILEHMDRQQLAGAAFVDLKKAIDLVLCTPPIPKRILLTVKYAWNIGNYFICSGTWSNTARENSTLTRCTPEGKVEPLRPVSRISFFKPFQWFFSWNVSCEHVSEFNGKISRWSDKNLNLFT